MWNNSIKELLRDLLEIESNYMDKISVCGQETIDEVFNEIFKRVREINNKVNEIIRNLT